ncbi:MAG: hypothetical protein IJE94_07510 [Oscillospiraceae bacterium]|nr:hypothetical protein [Oscillospiraceae bacterium]
MKKFFSLVLALVMALSLTTVAWGVAGTITDNLTLTATDAVPANILLNGGDAAYKPGTEILPTWINCDSTGKNIVIDLGGNTFTMPTGTKHMAVYIGGTGTVTIKNGTINGSASTRGVIVVGDSATVNLEDVTITAVRNTTAGPGEDGYGKGVAILLRKGDPDTTVNLLDGAVISAYGTYATVETYGTMNIYDGAEVTFAGDGTSSGAGGLGAALGTSGGTGVINIYGGTVTSTASGGAAVSTNSSGGTINISGGELTGDKAVHAYTYGGSTAAVNISGGKFTGALLEEGSESEIAVSGGTFTDDVSAYLPSNLTQTTDGVVVSEGGTVLGTKYDMVTTDAAQTKTVGVTVNTYIAKAPKDTNKDGLLDQAGNVEYFEFSNMPGVSFVQVNNVSKADYTVYQTGTKVVFGYFAMVASPNYLGNGVVFNDFGEKCGQFDDTPIVGAKYYLFQGDVYQAVTTSVTNLMVGNDLTPVVKLDDAFVDHIPAVTYDKDYKVTAVKCAECGTPAVLYANFASVPKADKANAVALGDGQWYVWLEGPGAVVDTDTKVESAETFDAGIALYVGMSVMAAAGSAVVIGKKKD